MPIPRPPKTSSTGVGALGGAGIGLVTGGPPGAIVGAALGAIGGWLFGKGKEKADKPSDPPKAT